MPHRTRRAPPAIAAIALGALQLLASSCRDTIAPVDVPVDEPIGARDAGGGPTDVDDGGPAAPGDGGGPSDAGAPVDVADVVAIAVAPIEPLPVGRAAALQAIATLTDDSTADVTDQVAWTSSAPDVLVVSNLAGERGTVRALAVGPARIEAALPGPDVDAGLIAGIDLLVVAAARDALTIDPPATSAPLGATMQLRAEVRMSDGALLDVTDEAAWTSLEPAIATVSDALGTKGRVESVADGVATIQATIAADPADPTDALVETALITVLPAAVVSMSVAPATRNIAQGNSTTYTATAVLTDGSSRDATADATWTTLDAAVAIPDGPPGKIRTLTQGSTTVEARYGVGGPAGTATLNVGPPALMVVTTVHSNGYALSSHGVLQVWGPNVSGQCARAASLTPVKAPVLVEELADVVQATGGSNHSLALLRDGTVYAWGRYERGQLGDGRALPSDPAEDPWADPIPDRVVGVGGVGVLSDVTWIAAGLNFSLALRSDGTVVAWGDGWPGQLGTGDGSSSSTPRLVPGLPKITAIAAGAYHALALDEAGFVWGFGWDQFGQLGQGAAENARLSPVRVQGPGGVGFLADVTAISAGWLHSVALLDDGTVWCFGANDGGQCGQGDEATPQLSPVQVKGVGGAGLLTGVTRIESGFWTVFATSSTGALLGWGGNGQGQLGVPTTTSERTTPDFVKSGGANITAIRAFAGGGDHALVLKTNGATLAWGENGGGELGDGTTTDRATPAAIDGL